MDVYSGKIANNDDKTGRQRGPLPGLLRPPLVFLFAILLGILLNWARSLHFVPPTLKLLGPLLAAFAVLLFLLSFREFRRAGTSVRGSERTTAIVRTGPYRFSRNPTIGLELRRFGLTPETQENLIVEEKRS